MFTKAFALATLERAVKTFAQSLIGALAVASGLTDAPWQAALSAAGLATLVSVLTSVVSAGVGSNGPSLGAETLTESVAAVEGREAPGVSRPGLVAGPAADVPEGDPVDVVPDGALGDGLGEGVGDIADSIYGTPKPGDEPKPTGGYWGGV